jgi:hypothetical protein
MWRSLRPLESVQKLQESLHAKAKRSPQFRFYTLYDKVYRKDVLWSAYQQCRANGGAAGVDGQTFEDIEAYGVTKWLGELEEELRTKTYKPRAGPAGAATVGHSNDPRPRSSDGGVARPRTDLRGRHAVGAVRLPSRANRVRNG